MIRRIQFPEASNGRRIKGIEVGPLAIAFLLGPMYEGPWIHRARYSGFRVWRFAVVWTRRVK